MHAVRRHLCLRQVGAVGVGAVAAGVQAAILQPTMYWKNAAQQGLPLTYLILSVMRSFILHTSTYLLPTFEEFLGAQVRD